MPSLIKNISITFISRIISVLIGLIVLPLFPKIIGFEAYGLIGFYTVLTGSLMVLDMGLSNTLNRELAQSIEVGESIVSIRDKVYSVERVFWTISLMVGIIIISLSQVISDNWLNIQELEKSDVVFSIVVMGIVFAFQWPQSLYSGAFLGLQKHFHLNIGLILFNSAKNFGALFILTFISGSVKLFFVWQLVVSLIYTIYMRKLLWKFLSTSGQKPKFSRRAISTMSKFALGMTGIGITTLILGQLDKFVVSKLCTLEDFGHYTFAFYIGSSIYIISGVFGSVLSPRLVSVVTSGDKDRITQTYHDFTRLLTSIVSPLALFIFFFSKEIMVLWTQNLNTATITYPIVKFVVIAALANTFFSIPYYLTLAYGWTKISIYQNSIQALISLPIIIYSVKTYGLVGGTFMGLFSNFFYLIVSLPIIHRRLMPGELVKFYINDIGVVLGLTTVILGLARLTFPLYLSVFYQLLYFLFTILATYILILFQNKKYRLYLYEVLSRKVF